MARATSTTRGKTKTTKRPAAAAKTTRSARTTKTTAKSVNKTTSKAAAAKEAVTSTTVKRSRSTRFSTTIASRWHFISAAIFLVLAVTAGVFMQNTPLQVTLGH